VTATKLYTRVCVRWGVCVWGGGEGASAEGRYLPQPPPHVRVPNYVVPERQDANVVHAPLALVLHKVAVLCIQGSTWPARARGEGEAVAASGSKEGGGGSPWRREVHPATRACPAHTAAPHAPSTSARRQCCA
jgi:hypothetical protein